MSQETMAGTGVKAWLLARSGSLAGTRFALTDGTTRVGRAPDNDAVIDGPDAVTVSAYHLEISRDGSGWRASCEGALRLYALTAQANLGLLHGDRRRVVLAVCRRAGYPIDDPRSKGRRPASGPSGPSSR